MCREATVHASLRRYINLAQQVGGIDNLLDSFFGFLRRKTDFLSGAASAEDAQKAVLKAFQKNKERADEEGREKAMKEKKSLFTYT